MAVIFFRKFDLWGALTVGRLVRCDLIFLCHASWGAMNQKCVSNMKIFGFYSAVLIPF